MVDSAFAATLHPTSSGTMTNRRNVNPRQDISEQPIGNGKRSALYANRSGTHRPNDCNGNSGPYPCANRAAPFECCGRSARPALPWLRTQGPTELRRRTKSKSPAGEGRALVLNERPRLRQV